MIRIQKYLWQNKKTFYILIKYLKFEYLRLKMTDLIKTVSLLKQELIISRVLDKLEQGSDEAFIQLRNELIKINNLKLLSSNIWSARKITRSFRSRRMTI